MKIALLGGSFNPPHIGHALIAQQTLELFDVDEVWLMPAYQHAFDKDLSDARHRLAMTQLLDNGSIKTSTFEIDEEKVNYTIETLEKLYQKFPNDKFYWIIGSDQLESFKKWKDWKKLLNEHNFLIFPRPKLSEEIEAFVKRTLGVNIIPKKWKIAKSKNLVQIEISSTMIRNKIKKKENISNMVPEAVLHYIKRNKLYE